MTVNVLHGQTDDVIDAIIPALDAYAADHPEARVDVYRWDPVSVRVRIVDPDFAGSEKHQRNDAVWDYLDRLPGEAHCDISTLLLLTPAEARSSPANREFDEPVPTRL